MLAVFDGGLGHGVLDSVSVGQRITMLVNWWDHKPMVPFASLRFNRHNSIYLLAFTCKLLFLDTALTLARPCKYSISIEAFTLWFSLTAAYCVEIIKGKA